MRGKNMIKIIIGEKVNTEGYSGLALACMQRYNKFIAFGLNQSDIEEQAQKMIKEMVEQDARKMEIE